ncbi:hypothetical protein [Rhodanobacter thiooxydans]|uniref:hypothetical protein n=1 Tax=Rhodanobacter thiooxydans TaxID=416169 RepID=UPI000B12E089|nr:hypothetical protein [Rhodanobacter thiooxydans]UJJ56671.1 hypothetical protein LRK53_18860 [Rhodanobacter thiooxydans]
MNIFDIATALGVLALGYFGLRAIRRAVLLRKHRVPALPKRVLPPPLPQAAQATQNANNDGLDLLELARIRQYEALGVSEQFRRPGHWR